MKITPSKDGKKRGTLRLEFRFDATYLATLVTAHEIGEINHKTPLAWGGEMMDLGERLLLEKAKFEIEGYGAEIPMYRVGDNNLEEHRDELARRLRIKFGLD